MIFPPASATSRPRGSPLACKLLIVLGGLLVLAAVVFFLFVGRWLVIEEPLERSQAIVVLSGRMPLRVLEAARLYRAGYSSQIWLTRSAEPGKALGTMDIPYFGEDFYNERVLTHQGVPPDAIHVLTQPINNTADEIELVASELAHYGGSASVIIVTSKPHTRRVRALWQRLARGRGRAIVRAAADDPFDPVHWWRTTSDAFDVLREVLGLLNAWAGLPLHPAH